VRIAFNFIVYVDFVRIRRAEIAQINIDRPENAMLGKYFKIRTVPTQIYLVPVPK
jgi:hypothetical protein